MNFDLIFDNAGGATIQTERGAVYEYGDMTKCAGDVAILLRGGTDDDWEGNPPARHLTYNANDEARGEYCWWCRADVEHYLAHHRNATYHNRTCSEFMQALWTITQPLPTPQEFAQMMHDVESGDYEEAHRCMDDIMTYMLCKLGYVRGVAIFDKQPKWYT